MKRLIKLKGDFDIAFGNDTDVDRHGIVTKSKGLLKTVGSQPAHQAQRTSASSTQKASKGKPITKHPGRSPLDDQGRV
jgi:phosphoglucomutase